MPMMKRLGIHTQLYDYLERAATDEQRKQGLDIADFLLDIETTEGKLEQMKQTNQSISKQESWGRIETCLAGGSQLISEH